VFNGSDLAEKFDLSANGTRARLTRDVGGVTMDLGGVESITVNALGGADAVTVNDLTGTPVTRIDLDLAATAGGPAGAGLADAVTVNGTAGADVIPVAGNFNSNGGVVVVNGDRVIGGPPYFLVIRAPEGAFDTLTVNALGGNDTVDASGLFATNAQQLIR